MSAPHTTGLRSRLTSYGDDEFSLFLRKAFIKGAGYTDDALDRLIIGIVDTASEFNPCHGNVPQLVDAVKRGVLLAGALPVTFPTISLHESFASPTSMFLRNLMSMDTEEMIRAQPVDAVVLVGGCGACVQRSQVSNANPSSRQDCPCSAHGLSFGGHTRDSAGHRPHAHRVVQRSPRWRMHGLPASLGAVPRR